MNDQVPLAVAVSPFSLSLKLRLQAWMFVRSMIFRFIPHKLGFLRIILLKLFGAKIGKRCYVHPSVKIHMPWKLTMGDHSAIDFDTYIYNLDKVNIGDYVSIAYACNLNTGTHDFTDPYLKLITRPINILSGAFIGTQAYVAPGVTVGRMAVIGARSIVTKDMPDDYFCIGTPAKQYKLRVIQK